MKPWRPAFICVLGLLGLAFVCTLPISAAEPGKPTDEQLQFFEKKIRPLFVENCYICHSEHHKEAGGCESWTPSHYVRRQKWGGRCPRRLE